ncbi:right-handed parallel beta-helix repeat-containing protein [Algisphaera agarilytica]|uniref:Nitrous oxidase accessory protein NosD n=1 Tax=Algisphaera agarilytica TaxID=1385975 RepID=A0A7X0LL57_9BACT|nr:right-handed parallel beta-helix repeat-containing protein [Algisphaera agarilytica]MBB6430544.1 nitrous oxidase accessory protein NosD [Algisphaera agarilytica]
MAIVLACGACTLGLTPVSSAQEQPAVNDAIQALQPAGQIVRWQVPADNEAIVLRNRSDITIRSLKIEDDVSVILENCQNITIISCDLRSIRASGVENLRIYNSHIHNSPNNAVSLDDCHDVVIQGNRIENVASGVYAHKSTAVQVVGNLCFDVKGPMPRGQLVQFDKVTGEGNLIMGNIAVNRHGQSNPEDMINLFQSVGTPESPIRVEFNHLTGDPNVGSQDKSDSGSGIMLGDGGGQHQVCANNTLVNPGQVGIGVAGGGDIQVLGNTIVGDRSNVANVGLYTWNQYANAPAGDVLVADNRVNWLNAKGQSNPYWNGDGFTKVTQQNNAFGDARLSTDRFPEVADMTVPPVPHGQEPYYPFPVD